MNWRIPALLLLARGLVPRLSLRRLFFPGSSYGRRSATYLWRCLAALSLAALNVGFQGSSGLVAADDDVLHVHIIPHSHCDPGWLDTFERYYQKDVSHILSGVLSQLWADRSRRFVWAEISFFKRWWITQNFENRGRFKTLVDRGQLEFIGGGWVQNDEANPTLESVINQVSEGHAFLLETFGVRPKIGWQIDPFGHSAMTPTLFALLAYDAMVINRIHFDTKRRFKATRHMGFCRTARSSQHKRP